MTTLIIPTSTGTKIRGPFTHIFNVFSISDISVSPTQDYLVLQQVLVGLFTVPKVAIHQQFVYSKNPLSLAYSWLISTFKL